MSGTSLSFLLWPILLSTLFSGSAAKDPSNENILSHLVFLYDQADRVDFFCLGSIIRSDLILTAKDCLINRTAEDLLVAADLKELYFYPNFDQIRPIKSVHLPENLPAESKGQPNELGILQLTHSLKFNSKVESVKLPKKEKVFDKEVAIPVVNTTSWPTLEVLRGSLLPFSECEWHHSQIGSGGRRVTTFKDYHRLFIKQIGWNESNDDGLYGSGGICYGAKDELELCGIVTGMNDCGQSVDLSNLSLHLDWIHHIQDITK